MNKLSICGFKFWHLYRFLVVTRVQSKHSQQYYVVTGFDTQGIFLTLYVQYIKKQAVNLCLPFLGYYVQ